MKAVYLREVKDSVFYSHNRPNSQPYFVSEHKLQSDFFVLVRKVRSKDYRVMSVDDKVYIK